MEFNLLIGRKLGLRHRRKYPVLRCRSARDGWRQRDTGATCNSSPLAQAWNVFSQCSNLDARTLILLPPTRPRNEAILQLGDTEQVGEAHPPGCAVIPTAAAEFLPITRQHRHRKSAQETGAFKMSKTILLTMTFLACTAWMAAQQVLPHHRRALPTAPVQLDSRAARRAARAEPQPLARAVAKMARRLVPRVPQGRTAAAIPRCAAASAAPAAAIR